MAHEVQENNNFSSGIKLFGATITPKQSISDEPKKPDDQDPTADKRPEKIIPCPRCKSMETKFCYFNNYNVNQPRHFCKGCQRYWTAGGALRNVPVGAGRRKAKTLDREMSEGCMFEGSGGGGVQEMDLDAVVEEWRAAEHGGFGQGQHLFPGKRRRCGSNSQSC
ncbi:hypothetical protein CASFOL_040789 [Castilleja foliolosa]|uniref:Dof-type domain-containing protein n=1 Tax=Castilleja foliolosa TaxID=1961234 RepID=A0ABD3BCK4_9LAMI